MIRLWDFETCPNCGKAHADEPIDAQRVPETLTCECGTKVGWVRQKSTAQIHRSISTLYNRSQADPQTGVDYESYEHKKAVLRARGRMTLRTRVSRDKSRSYYYKLHPAKIR